MASPDPIIDEIHRFREERAARFNYDLKRIVEDINRQAEELHPTGPVVSLPPGKLHSARP